MPKGYLIIHGGGTTSKDTTGALVKYVGSPDALIVVLGQTSETPVEKGQVSADWLRKNGATNVYVATVTENNNAALPELMERLEKAHGFWIPGGDQSRLMRIFGKTPVPALLRSLLERGGAGGGTSAGASLCGEWMPTGEEDRTKLTRNSVGMAPSLGLLPGFLIDSHFLARERLQRSVDMALSRPEITALGIDEGGWILVDRQRASVTVGDGQLVSVTAVAKVHTDSAGRLGCPEMRVRVFLPGETISLERLAR